MVSKLPAHWLEPRQDLKEAFDLAVNGAIKPIVSVCKLDEVNEMIDKMKNGEIKDRKVIKF